MSSGTCGGRWRRSPARGPAAAKAEASIKAEKLRVDQWREKEATRSAVQVAIHDFLYDDATGLPATTYSEDDVTACSDAVFAHVYRAYPTVPSPFYDAAA